MDKGRAALLPESTGRGSTARVGGAAKGLGTPSRVASKFKRNLSPHLLGDTYALQTIPDKPGSCTSEIARLSSPPPLKIL
ncbi:UNVERIFIED_CONTAM: hypothetical protein Slati_0801800 [Sesamum latifolium]|uniref:Uncharacterized protein n=1 Tax=Sesamum latifolium TaxID=2727402 RepID=A0AAW2XLK6_9LAMI